MNFLPDEIVFVICGFLDRKTLVNFINCRKENRKYLTCVCQNYVLDYEKIPKHFLPECKMLTNVKSVEYVKELKNLIYLEFDDNFDGVIDDLINFKQLETLKMGKKFNKSVEVVRELKQLKLLKVKEGVNVVVEGCIIERYKTNLPDYSAKYLKYKKKYHDLTSSYNN